MTLFSILFIEPYYSSPKNVITNSIPLLLVLMAIKTSFQNQAFWWLATFIIVFLITISIVSVVIADNDKSPEYLGNRISEIFKNIAVFLGQGKVLYSAAFIGFLLTYYSINDSYTLVIFVMWFFIVSINPKSLTNTFSAGSKKYADSAIGEIFSVQSKRMFLVKLFNDARNINKFDIVNFNYSMKQDASISQGIVFDTYFLHSQKWAKVLELKDAIGSKETLLEPNIAYKVDDDSGILANLRVSRFVGVVIEGSVIGKIKFEYSKQKNDLEEGDLLELNVDEKLLFYQVVEAITDIDMLEAKNESGFILGEAIQLGEWDNDNLNFTKYGWVPSINTPIFAADTSDIEFKSFDYPEYQLGVIPNTNLPSIINLHAAVSHHLALLGVTGSGKTFLAQEIIEQLQSDTKVICVDFTGEWTKKSDFISLTSDNLDDFLNSDDKKLGILELPAVSNTVEVIESTEHFISTVFAHAKTAYENDKPIRISLVLEEAHTIIPEGSFLGVNDWNSKAVVNKMGQVALQGRKFGVGLMVLAQRKKPGSDTSFC